MTMENPKGENMKTIWTLPLLALVVQMASLPGLAKTGARAAAGAQAGGTQKPNIMFIMGDGIGWMQVGVYHRGLGIGETPNIDRLALSSWPIGSSFASGQQV